MIGDDALWEYAENAQLIVERACRKLDAFLEDHLRPKPDPLAMLLANVPAYNFAAYNACPSMWQSPYASAALGGELQGGQMLGSFLSGIFGAIA